MKHIILGLAGYKTSGKDTTANIAREALVKQGAHVYHYAFADAVRMTCHRVFPMVNRDIWWDDSIKDNAEIEGLHEHSPRHWMRQVAQAIRALDQNFWATQVLDQISENVERNTAKTGIAYHFIKDLRFEEDWTPVLKRVRQAKSNALQQHNSFHAFIWWVERGLMTDGHASEDFTWLGRYDDHMYIVNNRVPTLHHLAENVESTLHIIDRMTTT